MRKWFYVVFFPHRRHTVDKPDALSIAFSIADESKQLVKLLAIGIRADGSVFLLDTGLTEEDANQLYGDFRVWVGDQLGKEMLR
jgi:hypothetical protein